MKIYVMSRTKNGNSLIPKVSQDFKNLTVEMNAEYEKVLKNTEQLRVGYLQDNDILVAQVGETKYTWRIDEILC